MLHAPSPGRRAYTNQIDKNLMDVLQLLATCDMIAIVILKNYYACNLRSWLRSDHITIIICDHCAKKVCESIVESSYEQSSVAL